MSIRFTTLGLAALCGAAATSGAWAAEYGTVISSTPVVSSAPVAQRECIDEPAAAPRRSSGTGAVVGALFGAALGNAVGSGGGRALATGIGMVAGAALGDHAEAQEAGRDTATAQRCRDVTRSEQRVVGYDVVYEYQGVQRRVRMAQPPGDRIALEVHVAPVGATGRVYDAPAGAMGAVYDAPAGPVGAVYDAPARAPRADYYDRQPAPRPQSARPVYRSPADNTIVDDDMPPPRTVYAPQQAPVYVAQQPEMASPWPYLIVGGVAAWAIANHHGGRSGPPRRYRR